MERLTQPRQRQTRPGGPQQDEGFAEIRDRLVATRMDQVARLRRILLSEEHAKHGRESLSAAAAAAVPAVGERADKLRDWKWPRPQAEDDEPLVFEPTQDDPTSGSRQLSAEATAGQPVRVNSAALGAFSTSADCNLGAGCSNLCAASTTSAPRR